MRSHFAALATGFGVCAVFAGLVAAASPRDRRDIEASARLRELAADLLVESTRLGQAPAQCPSVSPPVPRDRNVSFTAEQEAELGRIVKAQLALSLIIDEAALTGYLRDVGNWLISVLTSPVATFEFSLADLGSANALSLPGGTVFVSSQMVGMLRSEEGTRSVHRNARAGLASCGR